MSRPGSRCRKPDAAVVVRPCGELAAANPAFGVLTEGAPRAAGTPDQCAAPCPASRRDGPPGRNLAEWAATSPAACATGYSRALIRAWRRSRPNWTPTFPARIHTQGISASPVPLRLRVPEGELRLITTFTSFATAVDVTLSELRLEAFLPADETTAT